MSESSPAFEPESTASSEPPAGGPAQDPSLVHSDGQPSDWLELEREASRIVGMICREDTPDDEIQRAVDALEQRADDVFPDRRDVFELTYGRRIRRLRSRFRPRDDLLV